ncbi:MAG TPA: adenylate/guanylate cyclase domain-containing protein [Candidatus Baltobacteraceae bacterium]|nr:adenylate/guanylate cyclase domain-containing protein [Candidatus Baltobacteraceae bacterium]
MLQPEKAASVRSLPSGTVAFLFTDIEGSTSRWETHREAMAKAIDRHDALLQRAIDEYDGATFKRMGDAYCAVFRTAPQAIAAACAAQRALFAEDFTDVDGLKVRMAVHVGHADEQNGDYYGPSVNRVARLLAIGYGGQVLVSGAAADLAQGEMPAQTGLRDLGSHRLKDLAQPEQVYQLTAPDLPQKFFTLRSLDALPNNLPLQLTSFVGRDDEIERVKTLLDAHRLVTLVGTGGVGKSRLALQIGADVLERYEDGVWFIELAPLSDGTLILNELAPLFGVQAAGDRSLLDALLSALRPKRALLIVDNCEHLVDPAAGIIEKILRGCPNVRVLATSREALKIAGETVHRVSSLEESAAIALFADRANAASDSFELTTENTPTVAKICRRLDGIALAIELAAARVRAVDVNELFARLDERFRILTGGSRSALPRQQTMRALIDWSYDLLSANEQTLLRRVAVFSGGWTLEAATAICSDDELQSWDLLDYLTSLVDKSLVAAELNDSPTGSKLRYRLLESTRQYASEKLTASGERDRLRRMHAEYFLAFAERLDFEWARTPSRAWIARVQTEIDNVRAALDWALADKQDVEIGARIAGHLSWFFRETARVEGDKYVDMALTNDVSEPTAARLWLARAALSGTANWHTMLSAATNAKQRYEALSDPAGAMRAQMMRGEALTRTLKIDEGRAALSEALAYFTASDEPRWANLGLVCLARNALWSGDWALARERFDRVVAAARSQGDDTTVSVSLNNLAECEHNTGNTPRAIEIARELIAQDRALAQPGQQAFSLNNLSAYLLACNEVAEAKPLAHEALRKALDTQHPGSIVCALQHLGACAAANGDGERAAMLLGYTDTVFGPALPRERTEQREYDTALETLRSALGEERTAILLERGKSLPQEEAIALATLS